MAEYELRKYSKKIMLERIMWSIVWTITIRPFPRNIMRKWEIFVLRRFGAKIGKGCNIYSSAEIFQPSNLTMEDGSCIADNAKITNSRPFVMKKNSILSQYSVVYCGTHNIYDDKFQSEGGDVTLEEYSWVAAHCYLGAGVTIGRGARVGADSAVRKNVPPYAVTYGNPNKIVGFCHTPEEVIEKEKQIYPEEQRLPIDLLKKNYEKLFLKRIKEIREYVK